MQLAGNNEETEKERDNVKVQVVRPVPRTFSSLFILSLPFFVGGICASFPSNLSMPIPSSRWKVDKRRTPRFEWEKEM